MSQNDVTAWLLAWGHGDPAAESRLMEALYGDLRRVARRRLRSERADHSLSPTALVHEAYVRLVDLGAYAGRTASSSSRSRLA